MGSESIPSGEVVESGQACQKSLWLAGFVAGLLPLPESKSSAGKNCRLYAPTAGWNNLVEQYSTGQLTGGSCPAWCYLSIGSQPAQSHWQCFWKCQSALYHFGGHLDGSSWGGAQASVEVRWGHLQQAGCPQGLFTSFLWSDCCLSSSKQDWLPWSLLLFSLTCGTGAFYVPGVLSINSPKWSVEIKGKCVPGLEASVLGQGPGYRSCSERSRPSCGCRDHRPVAWEQEGPRLQAESAPSPPTPGPP